MSQYDNLKATIAANVYQNHNNEVTANMVKAAMDAMTDSLGAGYQYLGIATPTSPGTAQTPDQKVFYIATTPGTYTYLGGLVVNDGEVAILKWDTAWHKEVTGAATAAQVTELGQYVENPEWVRVATDKDGRILYGVKIDGKFYFGDGCPPQITDYINAKIGEYHGDDIVAFLNGLEEGDKTLLQLLNEKVDKVAGKSLIDENYASSKSVVDNPEFLNVELDEAGKIIRGLKRNGVECLAKNPVVLQQDEKFREIPVAFVDGDIDTSYNTISDNNAIHTIINDVDPRCLYLITVPDTMICGFVGKTESNTNIIKQYNTSGFSVKGCTGKLGIIIKNEYVVAKETPEVVNIGNFQVGTCDGGGNIIQSTKTIISDWVTIKGRFKVNFSNDVIVFVNIYNGKGTLNRTLVDGAILTSDSDRVRIGIRYKDERTITSSDVSQLISDSDIQVSVIYETDYDLTVSSLANSSDRNKIKIYRFIPQDDDYDAIVASSADRMHKNSVDVILNGNNDNTILQALVSCYNSCKIHLLPGEYILDSYHYNRYSDQYSCLSTFAQSDLNITISIFGGETQNSIPTLKVEDGVIGRIDNNEENAIFLSPRNTSVKEYESNTNTRTFVHLKSIKLIGNFYTKAVSAFDTIACATAFYEGMDIRGTLGSATATFPTMPNSESVGIRTGAGSNSGINNYIKHCVCFYCGKGYSVCGEHYILEDCLAHHCGIGFAFGDKETKAGFEHPNIMIGCSIEGCYRMMLLTKMGDMEEKDYSYSSSNYNKIMSTLIVIGLSTELSWSIPIDQRTEGGPITSPTLPILEILRGAYRGRIECDTTPTMPIPFANGSGKHFSFTTYNETTNIGVFNTINEQF